jgi:hypothetical protein
MRYQQNSVQKSDKHDLPLNLGLCWYKARAPRCPFLLGLLTNGSSHVDEALGAFDLNTSIITSSTQKGIGNIYSQSIARPDSLTSTTLLCPSWFKYINRLREATLHPHRLLAHPFSNRTIDMGQTPSTPVPSTTVVYLPPPPPTTVSPILHPVMFVPPLMQINFRYFHSKTLSTKYSRGFSPSLRLSLRPMTQYSPLVPSRNASVPVKAHIGRT